MEDLASPLLADRLRAERQSFDRYSMPFFVQADPDAAFKPLAQCVSPTNPPRYKPVTCGEHMFSRYKDSCPHLQDL